jgi:hypothetical protein
MSIRSLPLQIEMAAALLQIKVLSEDAKVWIPATLE